MCWGSNNKPVARIADRNITVYKRMWSSDIRATYIVSMCQRFIYKFGKTYTLQGSLVVERISGNNYIIQKGFHSYMTISRFTDNCSDKTWILCMIPIGAKYYVNSIGTVVSDSIKIVKILK